MTRIRFSTISVGCKGGLKLLICSSSVLVRASQGDLVFLYSCLRVVL